MLAHPAHIESGTINWEGDDLTVTLTLHDSTDALRWAFPKRDSFESRSSTIPSPGIVAFGSKGELLYSEGPINLAEATWKYRFSTRGIDTVALRCFAHGNLFERVQQFQCTWQPAYADSPTTVRLTKRGNHVVLQKLKPTSTPPRLDPFNEPVITIWSSPTDRQEFIQVDLPATVMTNWPDLLSTEAHAITTNEFVERKNRIGRWAMEHLRTSFNAEFDSVNLIDPRDGIIDAFSEKKCSVYTTRIRIRINAMCKELPEKPILAWTGFNAAFLRMPVYRKTGDAYQWLADLTPTNPSVEIRAQPAIPPTERETPPSDPSAPRP
jgi:hypothetical protein